MVKYPQQELHTTPDAKPSRRPHFPGDAHGISVLDYSKGFAHTDLVTC